MKVRCMNCGLVLEKCLSLKCVCPECGTSYWGVCVEPEEKIDGIYKATLDFVVREWLKKNGYIVIEKMGVPTMMEATMKARAKIEKEEGLAFEIYQVENGNKTKILKIYLNGHIEGFKGDPCIINHIYPKIMALKCLLQQMNRDYRDLIERYSLADLPIDLIDLSKLYQSELERIMNIVPTI